VSKKRANARKEDESGMPDPQANGDKNKGLPPLPSLLSEQLGLEGWTQYEPVLLAALASEEPLLLVGPHGSAKSFLLERLAGALGLEFRFYNASLINYDDLVGIPIPSEDRAKLQYISTPSAIWDAEVVFFDEINRTKPELQNKLFPIVYDRRVQGVLLEKLRFRWAAMNPAPSAEGENDGLATYLGAEPLDPALADRFSYLIEVPGWDKLTDKQRRSILRDQYKGAHDFAMAPQDLVNAVRVRLSELREDHSSLLEDYILVLLRHLAEKSVRVSTRRASTIHRNILAVHAARQVLYQQAHPDFSVYRIDWATSAITALRFSLPHIALGEAPDEFALLAAHKHAWKLADLDAENALHDLLSISDPVERCLRAFEISDRLGPAQLGDMVIEAVEKAPGEGEQKANALAFYLAMRRIPDIPLYVFEALAGPLEAWLSSIGEDAKHRSSTVRILQDAPDALKSASEEARLTFKGHLAALLNGVWDESDLQSAADQLARLWDALGLAETESGQHAQVA